MASGTTKRTEKVWASRRGAAKASSTGLIVGVIIAIVGISVGAYLYTQVPPTPPRATLISTSYVTSTAVSFNTITEVGGGATQTVTQTVSGSTVTQTQTQTSSATVTQTQTQTQSVQPIQTLKLATDPAGVAYDPTNGLTYVAFPNSSEIMAVNAQGGVVNTFSAPAGSLPTGVAVNPKTNMVYVTYNKGNNVTIIDATAGKIVTSVPVGVGPVGVTVNPATNMVYVGSENDDSVSVINGTTNTLIHGKNSTIADATFGVDNAYSLAIDPKTNLLYVGAVHGATRATTALTVVNASTTAFKIVGSYTIKGSQLTSLAYNSNTGLLYIANPQQNVVNIFDTSKDAFVANVTAPHAYALVLDARINRLLATDSISNYFTSINTQTNSVVGTVPVGNDPLGIDLSPTTNLIYVSNSVDGSLTILPDAVVP